MNKTAVTTGIIAVLCLAGMGGGSPVQGVPPRPSSREPGTSLLETHTFKAKERACVIAVGREGATFLGLYIYDEHGNCVTWDDIGTSSTKDDVAVEWFPTQTAPYTIELRNFGLAVNKLELAVR